MGEKVMQFMGYARAMIDFRAPWSEEAETVWREAQAELLVLRDLASEREYMAPIVDAADRVAALISVLGPEGREYVQFTEGENAARVEAVRALWVAQEQYQGTNHAHEWKPAGFTPHPRSGGLMPTDRCTCGAVRYPYSPDVTP
jgi:hypothetical protein